MNKPMALIIEDDSKLSNIFSYALRAADYEVEAVLDGLAARQKLQETRPDLILLDLHLPHVPGDVLLAEILADGRLKETKVVLATADAQLAEQLRPQVKLVLLKPVSAIQLQMLAERLKP